MSHSQYKSGEINFSHTGNITKLGKAMNDLVVTVYVVTQKGLNF